MQLRTTPIESAYKQKLRDEKRKITYNFRPKNNMVKATSLIDIKVTPIINRKSSSQMRTTNFVDKKNKQQIVAFLY